MSVQPGVPLSEVAERLREVGFRLDEMLAALDVITGSVDDAKLLDELRSVEGVDAVETGRTFQLPPPDAPIQ